MYGNVTGGIFLEVTCKDDRELTTNDNYCVASGLVIASFKCLCPTFL